MKLLLAIAATVALAAATAFAAGFPAPPMSGVDPVTGKHVSLAAYRGKPVIVNFWASWCGGCQQEAGDYATFIQRHPSAVVLGVDTQDSKTGAKAYEQEYGLRFPSIFDPNGGYSAKLSVIGLPTTFFLDSSHRIVSGVTGSATLQQLELGWATARATRG